MMGTADRPKRATLAGVTMFGPFGIVGGLGSACRGYLAALRAADIDVSVVPVNEMFVFHSAIGDAERRSGKLRHPISLVLANADSVPRFLHFRAGDFARARYRIGLWVWELPALRDEWSGALEPFDEIWTPSAFCQRAVQAMTAKPVTVMPYVVSSTEAPGEASWSAAREKFGLDSSAFVFLYMFDAASFVTRKNPQCLIDAFEAAFPGVPDVRLALKLSNADRNPEFAADLDAFARRDRRCVVLRQTMPTQDVAALIGACDCYVSPHRSEGFGLTVAEAMLHGLPVIATDYSGTADFVTDDVGFPLRYRLTEIEKGETPYPKGAIWAEPSRAHLRDLLRRVYANPGAAAAKGALARSRMLNDYSAAAVGRRMAQRLQEIASGDIDAGK
jgi:glycosyltransferase involved in cell wall biosynthesis